MAEFDEYEYLEKAVEKPDKAAANGGGSGEKERSRSSKHRRSGDEDGDRDSERRSKQSRSDERSGRDRHREKDRDRDSSRHRSPDRREKDRHRERDREEKERDRERDRDKEKSREREKERDREREKERDREKEKEKEREKEKEAERERDRSRRSRSRSERRRDEEHRERSREREFRERDREPRRYKDKKEDAPEPEADPERDQRTVFAYQLSLKADERDVFEFFSRAGKVRDVRLIMDRNSRRSKGVGYIEFYDVMSVPMAIALSGQLLLGQPVMVKPSEAEKNLVQSTTTAGAAAGPQSGVARRLYVGNLHLHITEEQLRQVFEPFGQVELVQLPLDPLTGHCKGYGFVQFARIEDARAAQSLNGQLEIAGRTIKVSAVTDQTGVQDVATNSADLDDDEGGGLSLNARSRALLMQKLDRTGIASSVAGALGAPTVSNPLLAVPPAPAFGAPPLVSPLLPPALAGLQVPTVTAQTIETAVPTECLLLKNMFDPSLETEPDFDLDIKEDVQDECSKFGPLKHIFVDKNSSGHVYLRFDSATSAINAQKALHGRWFAGKMITASFMLPQHYEAKFPSKT